MNIYSRVWADIDLDAVEANMRAMKAFLPSSTSIMGVVKADAYGYGAVPVARTIDPYVEGYAVATIDEGINLRRNGIKKMILVLGVTHESRFGELIDYDIRPSIFRLEDAKELSETAVKRGKRAALHLAVDTGMSRIGMTPDPLSADMVSAMAKLPGIFIEGIFTHFSRADEADKTSYEAQYAAYRRFLGLLRERGIFIPLRHCSNSAGIVEGLSSNEMDMVRAGIAIYGLYPSDEVGKNQVSLTPVMSLRSSITCLKMIGPGTAVSYGGTFVADHPMRVATIPVGYADGYMRSLSNCGSVLICGKRAPIIGRICMDQFMADVTQIPEAKLWDVVTLVGKDGGDEITVEELAQASGGFHYEILCGIGKRVPRVYYRYGEPVGQKDYFNDTYEGF